MTADIRPARPTWMPEVLVAVLLLGVVLGLQIKTGAYDAEFGAHPDEAAHYVTGLMVRDYIAGGLPGNPMAFAERYYDHYPKVALGNWPPGFYAIQAAWTLPFSERRTSVLVLMALLTWMTTLVVFRALVRELGWQAASFAALLLAGFSLTQQYSGMVMTEIPVALFSTMAMLAWGRWMDHQRARDSVLFGLLASMAIMTKGSGFALGLVPPLAILFTGRFDLLKRANLAWAAIIVLILAGPWTWMFREVTRAGWEEPGITLDYTLRALPYFPRNLLRSGSVIVAAFGLIGAAWALGNGWRRKVSGQWAAATALIVAVLLFHSIVPASLDYRHLTQAVPSWAMLAAAGVVTVYRWITVRQPRLAPIVVVIAAAGLLHTASRLPVKRGGGFDAVVEGVVKRPDNADARFLIVSDAVGEGMFIAETAMRERRPGHVIRRASKLLAAQAWNGRQYTAKVQTVDQLMATLRKEKIRVVVVDESDRAAAQTPHAQLLLAAAQTRPGELAEVGRYPVIRGYPREVRGQAFPAGIAVYELR